MHVHGRFWTQNVINLKQKNKPFSLGGFRCKDVYKCVDLLKPFSYGEL